jgi:hypothetical protein
VNSIASKPGFADALAGDLVLESGTSANIALQLNVAAGEAHVTVTGVAGEVRGDELNWGIVSIPARWKRLLC